MPKPELISSTVSRRFATRHWLPNLSTGLTLPGFEAVVSLFKTAASPAFNRRDKLLNTRFEARQGNSCAGITHLCKPQDNAIAPVNCETQL